LVVKHNRASLNKMSCEKLIIPSTHNKSEFSKSEILQTWKDPPEFDGDGGSVGNVGGKDAVC